MRTVERAPEVIIVTASPVRGEAIRRLLAGGAAPGAGRILGGADLSAVRRLTGTAVALIAPEGWEELADLLPAAQRSLANLPWLLLAEPLSAGMFLTWLQDRPCALVSPNAPPAALQSALQALGRGHGAALPFELRARFVRGLPRGPERGSLRPPPLPTFPELQCACAVSLGLSNRQIAAALHLSETSVKTYLYRLMKKLELHDRHALSSLVQQAFAASCTLSVGNSAY